MSGAHIPKKSDSSYHQHTEALPALIPWRISSLTLVLWTCRAGVTTTTTWQSSPCGQRVCLVLSCFELLSKKIRDRFRFTQNKLGFTMFILKAGLTCCLWHDFTDRISLTSSAGWSQQEKEPWAELSWCSVLRPYRFQGSPGATWAVAAQGWPGGLLQKWSCTGELRVRELMSRCAYRSEGHLSFTQPKPKRTSLGKDETGLTWVTSAQVCPLKQCKCLWVRSTQWDWIPWDPSPGQVGTGSQCSHWLVERSKWKSGDMDSKRNLAS